MEMLLPTLLATHLPPASASEGKKTVRGRIPQPLVLANHHQLGGTKQHNLFHSSGGQLSKLNITGPKSRCWWATLHPEAPLENPHRPHRPGGAGSPHGSISPVFASMATLPPPPVSVVKPPSASSL